MAEMKPGDVRVFDGGKAVAVAIGLWAKRERDHLRIDITGFSERLTNGCTDLDLTWWPLLRFRPQKSETFGTVNALVYSGIALCWIVLVVLALPICPILIQHRPIDASSYVWYARWYISIGYPVFVVCVIVLGLPPSVLLTRWAWNRRARRLARVPDVHTPTDNVWPPAPQS